MMRYSPSATLVSPEELLLEPWMEFEMLAELCEPADEADDAATLDLSELADGLAHRAGRTQGGRLRVHTDRPA